MHSGKKAQSILVKSDDFENSYSLLYILLKSCLCCCSLATLAPQQLSEVRAAGPDGFVISRTALALHTSPFTMVFYWIEQAGPDGSYDKNSYHMTRTAPRAISLENHKRKGPV